MGYSTTINGSIEGISKDSFDLIQDDLEEVFKEVSFKDNTIEIDSYGNHHIEVIQSIFDKIAFCIDSDGSGQLDMEGEECGDISTVFFVSRQWKQAWAEIIFPANPFSERGLNIS
jgi:hypothetical protein